MPARAAATSDPEPAIRAAAFLQQGPYGDPLALAPYAHALPREAGSRVGSTLSGAASGRAERMTLPRTKPGKAGSAEEEDDDDEDAPTRPGALNRGFARLPNPTPFLRNRSIGPHLSPSAEYQLSDRAAVGLIGPVERLDSRVAPTTVRPGVARPSTSAPASRTGSISTSSRGRDVGGWGLSLDYKLGQ